MSRGQRPRTPRYFPRMKVRGARRRQKAPFQRILGAVDRAGIALEAFQAAFLAHVIAPIGLRRARELAEKEGRRNGSILDR